TPGTREGGRIVVRPASTLACDQARNLVASSALLLALAAVFGANASVVRAQEPQRAGPPFRADTSHSATTLLRSAASHARDNHWSEAIDLYQKVIQQFGDKMAELPKDDPLAD